MSIPMTPGLCDNAGVNPGRHRGETFAGWLLRSCVTMWLAVAASLSASGEATNNPAATNGPAGLESAKPAAQAESPRVETASLKLDESAFHLISERNIFNANRSGGQVVLRTSRPRSVDSFTLVGTMAYEKGAFAFFEGSRSEYTKALKTNGVIAGHKVVDVLDGGVKLESDGKIQELSVGSAMRREEEGAWRLGEASAAGSSSSFASSRENGDSSRSSRSSRNDRNDNTRSRRGDSDSERERNSETGNRPATTKTSAPSAAEEAETLTRLLERREKD
jgi:hypothetical protein